MTYAWLKRAFWLNLALWLWCFIWWPLAQHWIQDRSAPAAIAVTRGQMQIERMPALMRLSEFQKKWSPQIQRWQVSKQGVQLETRLDLLELKTLVGEFPGTLESWHFSAKTELVHQLAFRLASVQGQEKNKLLIPGGLP
jgi:hypothetical protein